MKFEPHQHRPASARFIRPVRLSGLALLASFLILAAPTFAQDKDLEPPLEVTKPLTPPPDSLLPQIVAALQGMNTPDMATLSKALHVDKRPQGAAPGVPSNTLAPVGDLDGDGVPEMLLQCTIPDVIAGADVEPAPDSKPLWSVYLLSWDGAHWQASRLVTGVEDFNPILINLGPPARRGLAVVLHDGGSEVLHPAVFQLKDHLATMLWDAAADDSRFAPLLQGQVTFQDHAN